MWQSFSGFWEVLQHWTGYLTLMLVAVALLWPFERLVPRLVAKKTSTRRTVAIALVAFTSLVVAQAYAWWGQQSLIDTFVKLKVFSLAKAPVPDWLLIVLSMLLLDFLYFLAHFISHHVQPLWRLHKIHHADEHVTAFSSVLHHPFESLYVALFVTGFAVVLGLPVLVYVYFGVALALHAVFSHADIALPQWLDRRLRWVLVTPDVHRTHHSQDLAEGNSNFGAMFTLWDRLFGTYMDQTKLASGELRMGLPAGGRPAVFSARELLLLPFRR